MTLDQHRRFLAGRRGEDGRERRVVERMRGLAARGREGDRPRDGNIGPHFIAEDGRAPDDPVSPGAEVELDEGRRFGGRAGQEHRPSWAGMELREAREGERDRIEALGPKIEPGQPPDAVLDEAADDPLRRVERVGRHREIPLRLAELGLHRRQRLDRAVALAIEVPPAAAAVRNEIEIAVGRPTRLEHRFVRPARDPARLGHRAIDLDLADPRLGGDPRHVGMIPGEPGQALAIRAYTRRRVEVVARDEDLGRRLSAGEVDARQRVDHLTGACVVFVDADQAAVPPIDHAVGVAQRACRDRCRGEGARGVAGILAIETLVGEVREVDGAVLHGERAAAIFVHARADVVGVGIVGRHGIGLAARDGPVDEASSLLLRLELGPVDRVAVERDLVEPDRLGHDEIGGDRGRPGTVGARDHGLHPHSGF